MRVDQHILICSSFQTEIFSDAQVFFVDALTELQSSLWSYVPKLVHLFDVISNSDKLKTCQFKIELIADDVIQNVISDSDLLIDAFEYLN